MSTYTGRNEFASNSCGIVTCSVYYFEFAIQRKYVYMYVIMPVKTNHQSSVCYQTITLISLVHLHCS